MDLPLILAGPILRRVEPNLVSVWVALSAACTVKLSLWENQIKASDAKTDTVWFRSPTGGSTLRIGDNLHIIVVTLKLPTNKILVPERLYAYDLEFTQPNQSMPQTLKSLGLLKNDPDNADPDGKNTKHLALGYEVDLLPCVVLPPKALTDLKLVHGSCRNPDTDFVDGQAWVDDLLSTDAAYKSALKRPHQLFLTGDQIYADEVPRPLLFRLNQLSQIVFGIVQEQLPLVDRAASAKPLLVTADCQNFPEGYRHTLIENEAGMTTTAGSSHLMSFREFCAMYLVVWSNVCWQGFPQTDMPTFEELTRSKNLEALPELLRRALTQNANGEVVQKDPDAYSEADYAHDIARLTELHRTLPKVRRGMANVPTYMIFDDHEITDDWFLNPTWRDRVLGSPLGSAIIRNGMLAYALFQGWGNDPLKFEPVAGATQKQPHEQLLEQAAKLMPSGATTGPNAAAAKAIETLLGLDLRNQIATDGSYAETNPPLKWFYTVPGEQHQVLVLDCRTQRSFVSRVSPPGNIGLTAQAEQIPTLPQPATKKVWIVISSLPVLGPPIFDEVLAPTLFRLFDAKATTEIQSNRGTRNMPGTNPDAVEGWCFDPKLLEALLKRLVPYSPVVLLSGDVHYSATNAMSYWYKKNPQDPALSLAPARIVQFIASGLKNVMPGEIVLANRSFSILQKMIQSKIGAERLGWNSHSPKPVQVPPDKPVSPRLRALLEKSPVLIPTIGWQGGTASSAPDWAWRVSPIRDIRADDIRAEVKRPKMARPTSLFLDDASKTAADLDKTNLGLEAYHRVAERHARQLTRLNNCRQILFASSLAVVTFANRSEPDKTGRTIEVTYAIQDLYTVHADPGELTTGPKPQVYTRHEVALQDGWQDQPTLKPTP